MSREPLPDRQALDYVDLRPEELRPDDLLFDEDEALDRETPPTGVFVAFMLLSAILLLGMAIVSLRLGWIR